MTVKLPTHDRTIINERVSDEPMGRAMHPPMTAWENFCDINGNPYATTAKWISGIMEHLKEWGAVWLRSEGMLEFESEEKAVIWVMRWS